MKRERKTGNDFLKSNLVEDKKRFGIGRTDQLIKECKFIGRESSGCSLISQFSCVFLLNSQKFCAGFQALSPYQIRGEEAVKFYVSGQHRQFFIGDCFLPCIFFAANQLNRECFLP